MSCARHRETEEKLRLFDKLGNEAPGGPSVNTTSNIVLLTAVFGASLVEMVEALTIVVASGVTRGWRSALEGTAAAMLSLAILVGAVGIPLIHFVPLDAIRVAVGTLLLVLGLSWLRKAMLRAAGYVPSHDENRIFAETTAELRSAPRGPATRHRDAVGFAVAFKGVFLEGLEVVLIVVSLGASQHRLGLAALAAGSAAILVAVIGMIVSRQLSEVPENAIKTVVGIMLTSFGIFWVGEGAGIHWPGSDLAIPVLAGFFACVSLFSIGLLRANGREDVPVKS